MSGPICTSETPLCRPAASVFGCCSPSNGGRRGDSVKLGQEKEPSLLLAHSIQSRSLGSRKGGRPQSCEKTPLERVQLGKRSQLTSRQKMGRRVFLFCSSMPQKIDDCEPRSGNFAQKFKKKAWKKRFLWFLTAVHAVYIPSCFILTTCAVLSRDLSGENGPVCQARGGRCHLCCPGSLDVATPICIYICGESATSCWRMRASFIQSSSAVPSHGCSYLSAEVHKTVLWEWERGVFVGRPQTTRGELHEKGRRQKHWWRRYEGSDVASLWGILHLQLHECHFVGSQTFGLSLR